MAFFFVEADHHLSPVVSLPWAYGHSFQSIHPRSTCLCRPIWAEQMQARLNRIYVGVLPFSARLSALSTFWSYSQYEWSIQFSSEEKSAPPPPTPLLESPIALSSFSFPFRGLVVFTPPFLTTCIASPLPFLPPFIPSLNCWRLRNWTISRWHQKQQQQQQQLWIPINSPAFTTLLINLSTITSWIQ